MSTFGLPSMSGLPLTALLSELSTKKADHTPPGVAKHASRVVFDASLTPFTPHARAAHTRARARTRSAARRGPRRARDADAGRETQTPGARR